MSPQASRPSDRPLFWRGFRAMLPITTGVIPFGLVVGTVAASASLSLLQTMLMNTFIFAGASQLALVELISTDTPSAVVIVTGLIINLRFLLYSAASSVHFRDSPPSLKLFVAYTLTDQTYATLAAEEHRLSSLRQRTLFYLGSSVTMTIAWQFSVLSGFLFGDFAPDSLALDYAVPLSFVALVVPTLKDKLVVCIAVASGTLALAFHDLPMNLGLLVAALSALSLGVGFRWLSERRSS